MTTRNRTRRTTTAAAGGDADAVQIGPDFGEDVDLTVSAAADLRALTLGPFAAPRVDVQAAARSLRLGPFTRHTLTTAATFRSLRLGAFAAPQVSAAVAGRLTVASLPPTVDTYLDENAPDTSFGTADTLLAKTNAAVGQNEQYTYVGWDLTGYAGTTFTTLTIRLTVRTTATLSENAPFAVFTHPTQPFSEASTWNSAQPPPGTSRQTGTVQAATTYATRTITGDATLRANAPGNWMYVRVSGAAALGLATIQTRSREHTTAAERPNIDLQVTL